MRHLTSLRPWQQVIGFSTVAKLPIQGRLSLYNVWKSMLSWNLPNVQKKRTIIRKRVLIPIPTKNSSFILNTFEHFTRLFTWQFCFQNKICCRIKTCTHCWPEGQGSQQVMVSSCPGSSNFCAAQELSARGSGPEKYIYLLFLSIKIVAKIANQDYKHSGL